VDGNWTTSQSEPTADDQGNVNNVVDVGPAPTPIESATIKATEIGAGVAAGVVGAAAAATAAVYSFTDQVNGNTTTTDGPTTGEKKDLTETEKKADPAATLRQTADESTGSEGEKNTLTQTAKKADPAAALRETADEDIRSELFEED
jgi:negative regulator of sigma E activity